LVWDKAEKELKYAMGLDMEGVALPEAIREISRVLQFRLDESIKRYINVPAQYFNLDTITSDLLLESWETFDTRLQKFCNEEGYGEDQERREEARRKRREFLDLKNDIVRDRVEGQLKEVIAFHNTSG